MNIYLISAAAFVGVSALVGAVAVLFRGNEEGSVEERLNVLAGKGALSGPKGAGKAATLLSQMQTKPGAFDQLLGRLGKAAMILEQADTKLTAKQFFLISGGLLVLGAVGVLCTPAPVYAAPAAGLVLAMGPFGWILMRRKRRLGQFAAQLPAALELMSRALRAGHSLAAGIKLVADESKPPLAKEFQRIFEQQNLGQSLEDALKGMVDRVPNLDLKFFCTSVVLQRQTGGDLAEILDKISHLIRERFKIWGQVQALTGEGRLSGIVLLALPPLLFLAVWWLNPEYCMILFTDPMGQKMLMGAVFLQFVGALVIKKIINIKV